MTALLLLLSLSQAQADPGRTMAGLTAGAAAGSTQAASSSVRGHADYGLWRHLTVRAEVGWLAGPGLVTAGAGPQLDLVDSTWWRVGLTALPELVVSAGDQQAPGWTPVEAPVGLVGRTGLRVDWLLFWGLCLSGRADRIWADTILAPPDSTSWWEGGLGLSVRL